MSDSGALEALLRRDRLVILAALGAASVLAWVYIVRMSNDMTAMAAMNMPFQRWDSQHFAVMLAMWVVMMVGMMLPSTAPVLLLYSKFVRTSRARGQPLAHPAWFAAGYLLAWTLFSAAATLAQWALESSALLDPLMAMSNRRWAGLLLTGIGIYQWLPVKRACLANCRSPLSFIQRMGGFRQGTGAAVRLGVFHGFYCIGCCWALMCLLFVVGVMNLLWIAALTIWVLIEKLLPGGRMLPVFAGGAAVAAGVMALFTGG